MRQFYELFKKQKWSPLEATLSWSHYCELLSTKDINAVNYYSKICLEQNLSKRELRIRIKNKEYERLDDITKNKLINKEETKVQDFIKNPIIISDNYNYEEIKEKILKQLILEDIPSFLKKLGNGFCFIDSEYKIKLGERYNYIDLLLYNIEFNCYVVVELKVTELKKEHIGQIELYMNYIDKNIKKTSQDKTIGIIIWKKDNVFVMEYASDDRVMSREYIIMQKKCMI